MKKLSVFLTGLLLAGVTIVQAQTVRITGTVTSSEDGMPMPGVSVFVQGTTIGTTTNVDGKYELNVPADAQNLTFSFVGFTTQDVAIAGRSVVDVVMQPEAVQVEEVVVTALGIKRAEKATGYAIQSVKGDDIAKARETNVVNSLQGKIAGAIITNTSGAVGASTRIVLRGANSLSGDNQPLIVVDNVIINNSNFGNTTNEGVNRGSGINDINSDDIESISVLKGPNAAALYGSRAANGVIIITTKSGQKGKGLGVTVNSTTTFETPLRLPDFQNEYGQGSSGAFEFVDGAGGGINDGTDESWGPKLDIGLYIPQWNSPVVDGVRSATPWVSYPDNVKNFFELGQTYTNNVAVDGGSENTSFRLSYTNTTQKGMIPNTDMEKNNFSLNASVTPHKMLTVNATGNYITTYSENIPAYGYDAQNVMQQFFWFGRQVDIEDLKTYTYPDGSKRNWNYNYHNNPYFTLHENLNGNRRDRFYGNTKMNFKFTDWLSAHIGIGADYYTNHATSQAAWGDIDNKYGYYYENKTTFREVNTDFLFMVNKNLTEDLDFSLNLGGNRMDQFYQNVFGSADELAVPDVYTLSNSKVPQRTSNYMSLKRINSLYFSGQFAWKNALFLDFTGRNDWSSTLPEDNNSYFYPSVSLSGVLTDLFGIQSDVLSFAKLRASWAQVGDDTSPYQLQETMSFGDGWNDQTKLLNMYVPNTLPNLELKPQYTNSIEVGGNFRFFMNRVNLDVTYYNQKTYDQIISVPISPASGYLYKNINAGQINNSGVEVSLNLVPVKTNSGFEWNLTLNYAQNKNEVVELAEGVDRYVLGSYWSMQVMAIPGEPFGSLYGYDFERDPDGNVVHVDGLPQQGDLKVLGNYTPDWIGSMNNEFVYKNLSFSFLIDTRQGGDIYTMTTTWGRYAGVLEETLLGREDGIVGDGVKQAPDGSWVTNDVVVSAEEYNKAAFNNNIAYPSVFDASFVKLREVKLGYTFPKIGNLPIHDLSISFVGRNLALLYTKVPHIDPETAFSNTNVQGIEFGQLPSARSFGFNVSVKF